MEARFGSHGDRPAVVLTASSVAKAYQRTEAAFRLAERHRLPVLLLLDAVVAHMREPVDLPEPPPPASRKYPALEPTAERFGNAPFVPFGEGPPVVVTGLSHDRHGLPRTGSGRETEQILRETFARLAADPELAEGVTPYREDEARVLLISYGITARTARAAVDLLRQEGVPAGLLELEVLWPFPERRVAEACAQAEVLFVVELSLGQLALLVRATLRERPVHALTRADGGLFTPEAIADLVRARLGSSSGAEGGNIRAETR